MTGWLFQGVPDKYKIDDYLDRYPYIYWAANQYSSDIRVGDTVFLWRAKRGSKRPAGVVARGIVVEDPTSTAAIKYPEFLGEELWLVPAPSERLVVGIKLDEVRLTREQNMITRELVKRHPGLAHMTILKFAQNTNYRLEDQERRNLELLWATDNSETLGEVDEASYPEGWVTYRTHRYIERNSSVVKAAKNAFLSKHGRLYCEICDFDFGRAYDGLGDGFIEAHHVKPVHTMAPKEETKPSDLMMVCSNCHRMLHRCSPATAIRDVKSALKNRLDAC